MTSRLGRERAPPFGMADFASARSKPEHSIAVPFGDVPERIARMANPIRSAEQINSNDYGGFE